MMQVIDISPVQLALSLLLVGAAGLGSLLYGLRLERDLLVGSIRTFVQLFLVGYVLKFVFALSSAWLVLLVYVWMIFWAAHAIRGRVKEKRVPFFVPTFVSMTASYLLVTTVVTAVIIRVDPWYTPRYFIPLGGMIIGNSMNAVSIALDRLFSDLRKRRREVELALCFGATGREATHEMLREAIRAGMIPSINALMTVGLVSLPGMMTGQILAGSDPVTAIKYQIVVMLMIVAATATGCVIVVSLVRRRCFTHLEQLRV